MKMDWSPSSSSSRSNQTYDRGTASPNSHWNWFWIQWYKFCSAGAFNVIDTSDKVRGLHKKLEFELSQTWLGNPKIQQFIILPFLDTSNSSELCPVGGICNGNYVAGPLWGRRILHRFAASQRHDDVHGELHHHASGRPKIHCHQVKGWLKQLPWWYTYG